MGVLWELFFKLNESAKSNGLDESYSIRHNGEVWKFTKTADGWKRALNWTFIPSTPATTPSGIEPETGNEN